MKKPDIIEFAGRKLDFSKGSLVMGILNVTADSFSDGGKFCEVDSAVAHGLEMVKAGADIIDIGAESTRPGSLPVDWQEQVDRAVPVIEKLAGEIDVPVSIDTADSRVAKEALKAGASIINDVTAFSDADMAGVAREFEVPVILMHIQGRPETMQKDPKYDDVVESVLGYLLEKAKLAEEAGIKKEHIIIDPGIGFGKTFEHNLLLLKHIDRFVGSNYRVLVGTSRKIFLGTITSKEIPQDRIFGTAATVAFCAERDVAIVRVHDVEQMRQVVKVINAIKQV